MKRKEFIKQCVAMGAGFPFLFSMQSCFNEEVSIEVPQFDINFSGKVVIVGAGAAGLTAGYLLHRNNIDFEIIEAGADIGGRVKRAEDFADFPIDLGAEWIHTSPSILAELTSDPEIEASIDFVEYNPQSIYIWKNEKLKKKNWANNFYSEHKFKNTTWYGFLEKYIAADIRDRISLNQPVTEIDYSGNKIILKTTNNTIIEADKVLITVPIKILQENYIDFTPKLPNDKIEAIDSILMDEGLKVFIEFKEKFYPDMLLIGGLLKALNSDNRIFYDAAFRKDAQSHVLALFAVGDGARPLTNLNSDQEIIDKIMNDLDEIFEGKATENYIQHIVQNWSKEPFIGGSYSSEFSNGYESTMNTIKEPIDKKIYFAGEALSADNQATVHGACQTAYEIVEVMLKN